MVDEDEKIAESQWRDELRQRIIAARGVRTQAVMAELLGIKQNTYGKYEARGSMMPVRLMPRFCKICGISLEEFIEGPKYEKPHPKVSTRRAPRKAG